MGPVGLENFSPLMGYAFLNWDTLHVISLPSRIKVILLVALMKLFPLFNQSPLIEIPPAESCGRLALP
jgi:hypothetical protein